MPPTSQAPTRAAIFLDRDGTLMKDVEYCGDPALVAVFEGAADALLRLKAHGYLLIMITNQSGIGRGYFSETDFRAVQEEVLRQLGPGVMDACYHCPDAPSHATGRRKPAPGMVLEAAAEHGIDLRRSFFIGDSAADIECAGRAGLAGAVFVSTGNKPDPDGGCRPDAIARNLGGAADWILQRTPCCHG